MLEKGTKVFGHWSVEEKIGSGAFGTVYKLRREEFGTEYFSALKVISIPPENVDSSVLQSEGMSKAEISTYYSDIVMCLMEEIKLLEDLKGNSNIVSYEDHIVEASEDGMSYTIMIRMELLEPFKNKIIKEILDSQEICKLGIDICNALELCEKKKIIHRDIKPDNIFISNIGSYKLGDFGVARTMEKTVAAMSQKGTYSYMAPEVFSGKEYNQNVDLYSLGILLYQLFNKNRTPFLPEAPLPIKFSDREEAQKRRMSGEMLPKIKNLSDAWNSFLLKACHPEPAKRFQTAAEMKAELEKMLGKNIDSVRVSEDKKEESYKKKETTPEINFDNVGKITLAAFPPLNKPIETNKPKKEPISDNKQEKAEKEQEIPTSKNNSDEFGKMSLAAFSSLNEPIQTNKSKKKIKTDNRKKEKGKKEYLEWLMSETTSPKYTLFFLVITILNSIIVSSYVEERCEYFVVVLAMCACFALLIVKLVNFILAIIGKNGFLKTIPLYLVTTLCNMAAISIFSDAYISSELLPFVIGIICLIIPFFISLAYKPGRKIVFFITRLTYYLGVFFYACLTHSFMRGELLGCCDCGDSILFKWYVRISLALSVIYPIIINKFIRKKELTKKGN